MKQTNFLKTNNVVISISEEVVDFNSLALEERKRYINECHLDYFTSRAAREGNKILSIEPIYRD